MEEVLELSGHSETHLVLVLVVHIAMRGRQLLVLYLVLHVEIVFHSVISIKFLILLKIGQFFD